MFHKILVIFVALAFILGAGSYMAFAQTSGVKAVDVGNKICPVSGEAISSMSPVTYEYQGKIYHFCCPACINAFKKDPQKYIEKVEEELKAKK